MEGLVGSIWTHWHGHPDVLLGLAVLQGAYLLGVGPLRERYGLGDAVDPKMIATFTAGVLVILVSLISPLHVLSDSYLFSAHMLQHVLLTLVAPPLLILGTPDWLLRPLLRPNWSFRLARLLVSPLVAFGIFSLVFSLWHVPALYNMSIDFRGVHIGEHLLFIGTAVLMWWPLTSNMPELPRLSYPFQMVYLFALSVAQIIVFGMITFAPTPIYEFYVNAPRIWALSPLSDQQIGGLIMKLGGGLLFMTLLIVNFFRWYKLEESNDRDASENERNYGRHDGPALEDNQR